MDQKGVIEWVKAGSIQSTVKRLSVSPTVLLSIFLNLDFKNAKTGS